MTRQRWQVIHGATGLGHGWIAQPEEEGPGAVFDTWREAMGHADRMSRTVEVELPRKPGQIRIGRRTHAMITQEKNGGTGIYVLNDSGEDQIIFMKAKYLQPLALALLAHAERSAPCDFTKQKSRPNQSSSTDSH